MSTQAIVQIIGAPVGACGGEVKDTWREMAAWAGDQLTRRFGDAVCVQYFDLLDPNCPALPADAQLPLVTVNGDIVSSGRKISIPALRRKLEALGLHQMALGVLGRGCLFGAMFSGSASPMLGINRALEALADQMRPNREAGGPGCERRAPRAVIGARLVRNVVSRLTPPLSLI